MSTITARRTGEQAGRAAPQRPARRPGTRKVGRPAYGAGVGAAVWLVLVLVPLYFLVATSLRGSGDYLTAGPLSIPEAITFEAYQRAFEVGFLRFLTNSLIVAIGAIALVLVVALPAAFATGLAIAAYTVVDAYGVRFTQDPLGYITWIMVLQGPVFFLVAAATRRGRLLRQLRPVWKVGLAGGAISAAAYGIVLWAQLSGALAGIAALRETSIVFAALLGSLLFKERFGAVRVAASAIVVCGVLLLAS